MHRMKFFASSLLCAATAFSSHAALAYNSLTHQEVVNTAWEVMVASQDPALTTRPGLFGDQPQPPQSLRTASAPLNQGEWDTFLVDIKRTILALSRMPVGLPRYAAAD